MTQTLTRERKQKFEEIIYNSELYKQSRINVDDLYLEVQDIVTKLAEASLSRTERKTDEVQGEYRTNTAYNRGEQERPDKVSAWLQMIHFAGAKNEQRIDAILSYLGESFTINTSRKEWKDFAKYILSCEKQHGWQVEVFVKWLKAKPDFDLDYWTARRMEEHYPRAFTAPSGTSDQKPNIEIGT